MELRVATAPFRSIRPADPDAALVEEARRDPRAFLALYERYFERVLGYVRLRIRDTATCEDVTSHVFTTALAELGRFRGDGTFSGWLFQIARNAVHDVQRRPTVDDLPDDLPEVAIDPTQRLVAAERAVELRRLIAALTPAQQHLLALRYGAGLSFDEIGALFDIEAGTARVRLHRLLHDLRARYPHDA